MYLEILLFLMDLEMMEGMFLDKDKFLDIFYDKYMDAVVVRIIFGKEDVMFDEKSVFLWVFMKIVDLFIFLV